ncbi:PhzF family phenazine biosynthesis protein [Bordetella sp. 2513F-2]
MGYPIFFIGPCAAPIGTLQLSSLDRDLLRAPTAMECLLVDTFTDGPDSGNPAAVCPLHAWPHDAVMLDTAARLALSETAFIVPRGGDFDIRWFTPTKEIDMIGHATLAAGCVVLERLHPGYAKVVFHSRGDTFTVSRGQNATYSLEMPALPPVPLAPESVEAQRLAAALGETPIQSLAAKHYLCIYDDADTVRALAPDLTALAALNLPAVIATAPGRNDIDFVSRFFAPANGVPEDPVSGVAHLCLTPYWASRLGRRTMVGRALSARGGVVQVEHRGATVLLGGRANII